MFIRSNYSNHGLASTTTVWKGVDDNFDFSRPASDWVSAARYFGGTNGILDLVVGQANNDGRCWVPFPIENTGYIYGYSDTDLAEPYIQAFDDADFKVILNLQPLQANAIDLINLIVSRYSHHKSIVGVLVDIEWKKTGVPYYVNNEERDAWLRMIKYYNQTYKLFLTYFKDYTHFPDDAQDLVIVFDGQLDTQDNLMREYRNLAQHFKVVGIATGYSSNSPRTATDEQIMEAAPNTQYIFHSDDAFSPLGDINGDGIVNIDDLYILAQTYGSRQGNPNWNPNADIDDNGIVGLSDLVVLAKNYGTT
jgi:hypothetical protein